LTNTMETRESSTVTLKRAAAWTSDKIRCYWQVLSPNGVLPLSRWEYSSNCENMKNSDELAKKNIDIEPTRQSQNSRNSELVNWIVNTCILLCFLD
jgi:hypothetical protein